MLTCEGVNTVQSSAECFVEDVADSGSSTKLSSLDVPRRAVHCGHVAAGGLGDDLKQGGILVDHVLAVGVHQGLELGGHNIDPGLELRKTVSDVMHQ